MVEAGQVCAIILAAGLSSRMGSFKPLCHLGGKTLLEHTVQLYKQNGVAEILVVVGHRAEEIKTEAIDYPCRFVDNCSFQDGMFSSIQVGVSSLPQDCRAFFLHPVDIPFVQRKTVGLLLKALKEDDTTLIHYPQYHSKKGHPPLISISLRDQILEYDGTGGLRSLLAKNKKAARLHSVQDPYILIDADAADDLSLLNSNFCKNQPKST